MRKCGTCNVCCSLMGVPAVPTESFSPCPNLRGGKSTKSCSVYSERPKACEAFKCGWLMGVGSSKQRPDRVGMMMTTSFNPTHSIHQIQVYQTTAGTWTAEAKNIINKLSQKAVVIHMEKEVRTILGGPRKDIELMVEQMRQFHEDATRGTEE